jgi:metal-responsive CopG/Arc/MetJ family transcriptional regulator
MKSIQVLFDESLLERLDADDEVKRDGRSAVLRRAAASYLRGRRARATAEAYQRAYGKGVALDTELAGWTDEGAWPEA